MAKQKSHNHFNKSYSCWCCIWSIL